MKLSPWTFIRDQFRRIPDVSTFAIDLTGKVVIVTGSNVGLVSAARVRMAGVADVMLGLRSREASCNNESGQAVGYLVREPYHVAELLVGSSRVATHGKATGLPQTSPEQPAALPSYAGHSTSPMPTASRRSLRGLSEKEAESLIFSWRTPA